MIIKQILEFEERSKHLRTTLHNLSGPTVMKFKTERSNCRPHFEDIKHEDAAQAAAPLSSWQLHPQNHKQQQVTSAECVSASQLKEKKKMQLYRQARKMQQLTNNVASGL